MKTPLTKNLIIKYVGESAVTVGDEYPYPAARPIILEAIQGPAEPPTLLCWTGKGYERLVPIADITDPTNITGCALKFDSTLDYIDVYKLTSIDPHRLEVSDGKLIGAEFAYEGRADANDTQSLLLSFESGGGGDVEANPEVDEGSPTLTSIGINGTGYKIQSEPSEPFDYGYTISGPIPIDPLIMSFQPSETIITDFDSDQANKALITGGKIVINAALMFGDEGEETTINVRMLFDDEITVINNTGFLYSDVEVILPDYYGRFKASLKILLQNNQATLTLYPSGPIQYYDIGIAGLDFTTEGLGSGWELRVLAPRNILDYGFKGLGVAIDNIMDNWATLKQSAATLQGFLAGIHNIWKMGYQVNLVDTNNNIVMKPLYTAGTGVMGVADPTKSGAIALFDNNDIVRQFSGTDFDYTVRYFDPTPIFIN